MSYSYINDLLLFNFENVYSDSAFRSMYNMCTYCLLVHWNPDIELLRAYMPEFFMLFNIFTLLTYFIFCTFSSVLSAEREITVDSPGCVYGIHSYIRNKQLQRLAKHYPPAAWLYRVERKRCEFANISGETAGRSIYGLASLLILCTMVLLCVFDSHVDFTSTPFCDIILLRNRQYCNSIVEFFILLISAIILYVTYSYNKEIGIASFEYYIIMLFCICSFCFFLHATNLILLYVLIELQSISCYILTALRKINRYAVEAGLKYFILGSFTSIVLVFGFALLYGFSGMLHIPELSLFLTYVLQGQVYMGITLLLLYVSLLCILVGFLFKIYAAPFHFWVADIYQGSPTSITIFLSTIPVVSYVYVFTKIYVQLLSNWLAQDLNILSVLAIMSLLSGAAGALVQKKIKKLIAYSSVTTIGYILASLSCHSLSLVQYSLLYLFVYVTNILPVFILMLNYRINNSVVFDSMYSFTTLFYQNKWLCLLLFSFFLSLAGIPPFAGFFSKLYVFSALSFGSFYMLLLICIAAALFSSFYYVRVIKMAYHDIVNLQFFVATTKYTPVFISVMFWLFNALFFFLSDIIEDVCMYIALDLL